MATPTNIIKAAQGSSSFLEAEQKKHLKMVEKSIRKLQNEIINNLNIIKTDPRGRIQGIKFNLASAQKMHERIEVLFEGEFNAKMRKMISGFSSVKEDIKRNFKTLGEAANFTDLDDDVMKVMQSGNYQTYLNLSGAKKDMIIQGMYDQVIAQAPYSNLIGQIQGALMGSVTSLGTPMINFARLYARDMIMNFHNQNLLRKGEEIGLNVFLYLGNIQGNTRKFCRQRVGNAYTKDQINSWDYKWQGKSGPAMTNRGGYNCRHHWQPVKKEWLTDAQRKSLGDAGNETDIPQVVDFSRTTKTLEAGVKKVKKIIPDYPSSNFLMQKVKDFEMSSTGKEFTDKISKLDNAIIDAKLEARRIKTKMAEATTLEETTKLLNQYDLTLSDVSSLQTQLHSVNNQLITKKGDIVRDSLLPPSGGNLKVTYFGMEEQKFIIAKTEAESLLHPDLINKIPKTIIDYQQGQRAYYNIQKKIIVVGNQDPKYFIHELGHHIEAMPGKLKKAREFLEKRIKGESLSEIYNDSGEFGWRDKFFSHYCGKDYSGKATEIISMGLEKMYKDSFTFLRDDPEYFDFILRIMWGIE